MSKRIARALPIFTVATASLFAQNGFNYANFSSISGLALNGSAAQAGSVLRLTNNNVGQTASAWVKTQQRVEDGFTTNFQFQITGNKAGDGIAFVIQNSSLGAFGGSGGSMGYAGIPNSLAVEFDIFADAPYDPNGNHVGVESCGTASNTQVHTVVSCNLGLNSAPPVALADGNVHTAVIRYLPGQLTLSLDGTAALTVAVNLSNKLHLNGGNAWVGFTGATGGVTATQDILRWSFTSLADVQQISYAANLGAGESVIDITNAGTTESTIPGRLPDYLCANVYTFAQDQQLVSCCACNVSPNDLRTLSIQSDLINNTLTPGIPTAVTVALVATDNPAGALGTCNAATVNTPQLASGLRAWATTLHALRSGGYAMGETKFRKTGLSTEDLAKMTSYCGFIQANGGHYGICNSCAQGARGAKKK